jgi:hypothetical protein
MERSRAASSGEAERGSLSGAAEGSGLGRSAVESSRLGRGEARARKLGRRVGARATRPRAAGAARAWELGPMVQAHTRRKLAGAHAIRRPNVPNLKLVGAKPRGGDVEHAERSLTGKWR